MKNASSPIRNFVRGNKFLSSQERNILGVSPVLSMIHTCCVWLKINEKRPGIEYFDKRIKTTSNPISRCAPSCTTYASPQLSKEEFFHFSHVEVYAVGDKPEKEDDGNTRSVLDRDPEAQAVMEMMGKTFISKDVRAADKQTEKELKQQLQQQQEKDPAAAAATSTSWIETRIHSLTSAFFETE